ncbi:MAG: hypothetical protein QM702_13365 [Rubrivivax sp.]
MSTLSVGESVVKIGTFRYDGTVLCDVRIVFSPVHFGTSDLDDPAEVANDRQQSTYYIQFGSTTERGDFQSGSSGFRSLAEAIAEAESIPGVGPTLEWQVETKSEVSQETPPK